MIGDLMGALCLGLSTMTCVQQFVKAANSCKGSSSSAAAAAASSSNHCQHGLVMLVRAPFSVSVLLSLHGILHVMLGQSSFAIALTGQILMGTVYVFLEQTIQEMILMYSFGNAAVYRQLLSYHYLVFTAGCALGSPLAYGLYEATGDFPSAFFATAGFTLVVGLMFTMFYVQRLSGTKVGFSSFVGAEEEIWNRNGADSKPTVAVHHEDVCSTHEDLII